MSLFLLTPPHAEPITVDEAKAQYRFEVPDEDDLVQAWIVAAREYTETFIHRRLLTQTWALTFDAFPCWPILLPFPPVTAVTSIRYLDATGTSTTWAAANYLTDLPTGPHASRARITPAYGIQAPATYPTLNAVTVTFECGYGEATDVPASLTAALKLLVAHWAGPGRVPVNIGNIITPIPLTVESLLWPYKSF